MKIWARGERQGSLCPVCGKENLRWHIWCFHLGVTRRSNRKICWCGREIEALDWEKHMIEQGGHLAHYLASVLNIGG